MYRDIILKYITLHSSFRVPQWMNLDNSILCHPVHLNLASTLNELGDNDLCMLITNAFSEVPEHL